MSEYFIVANSFAAPFFSDQSTKYVEADSPKQALERFAEAYKHPAGLYAALCYFSADHYHKGGEPLAKWLSNHEQEKAKLAATRGGAYSYLGHGPGEFEIDHVRHIVDNPKAGRVVTT